MTIALLEFVSRMGFGKQVVQAEEGERPQFQAVSHAMQLIVGLISALLVLGGCMPIAMAFKVPELTWAFAALAVIPLLHGIIHLDIARFQRQLRFAPAVLCEVLPQGVATAAAYPLAVWLGDFRAVLWIMLGKEVMGAALSHLLAERRYQLSWQSDICKRILFFGWPLIMTGLVMFASQQGDQLLVGSLFSLSDLGTYSIAFTIATLPFFIFGQVGSSLMLPVLSRQQHDPVEFESHYRRCLQVAVVGALVVLGPLVVMGGDLVRLVYGSKYSGTGILMVLLGTSVALRFFRWAPMVAAMARADTMNSLVCNIARSVSLPVALLVVAFLSRSVAAVAACGLIGEVIAILVSVWMVRKKQGIGYSVHVKPIIFLIGWVTLGAMGYCWIGEGSSVWFGGGAVLTLYFLGGAASYVLFPELFSWCRQATSILRMPLSAQGQNH